MSSISFPKLLFIGFITLLFLFRIIVFAGMYGGVEHDSGWFMGVAKNLALHGIYASYTNPVTHEGAGAFPSIHRRYSVQDKNGFVYFPAALTVGPGYVIPEAMILKLFGSGWWQYRMWPLLGFTLMLFLTLFVVWRIGGMLPLLFFSVWLWIIPQFTTQFAYESFSEDIAFLYLLAGYFLLYVVKRNKWSVPLSFLAGIFIGLSYLTKIVFVIPLTGVIAFVVWDFYHHWQDKKYLLRKWFVFIAGLIIPILLFYFYEYMYVMVHFGIDAWHAVQEDNRLLFINDGSGLNFAQFIKGLDPVFLYLKFNIWVDVGINFPIMLWTMFLLSPFVFMRLLKTREKIFCSALYIASFLTLIWYMFFSTGMARHAWPGLIIGMMIISICIGLIHQHLRSEMKQVFWILLLSLCLIFINYPALSFMPVMPETTISTWESVRTVRGLNGFPSNDILSLKDQQQVIDYFALNIKPVDRIYYLQGFLNAEISPLVDKVFYPMERYVNLKQTNPSGGKSFIIIGPYQQGRWARQLPTYIPSVKKLICQKIELENPSYTLCEIKPLAVK